MPKEIPGSINLLLHSYFLPVMYKAVFILPLSFTCLLAQTPTPSIQGSSEALHSGLNSSDPIRDNPSNLTEMSEADRLRGAGMSFTPNKGQFVDMNKQQRPDILYKGEGGGSDIYLRKSGISYVLTDANETFHKVHEALEEKERNTEMGRNEKNEFIESMMSKSHLKIHRIDVDFIGGNENYETTTSDQIEGQTNYYLGHCPQGITNVNSYNRITAKNIYPNIDVVYYGGKEKGLKYDIVVNPGGDPNRIKLKYSGVDEMTIKNGELRIKNSVNEIVEKLPKVYQNIDGKIVDVKTEYRLVHLSNNNVIVHFSFSIFNPSFPLVVDPWATYYSGSSMQSGGALCADGLGNVIFTGQVSSTNFPVSAGAFQMSIGNGSGYSDAFVVKFSITGTRVFGTYFGGNKFDAGHGMAADGNNDILISGITNSTNFPTKNPAGGAYFQSALSGGTNSDAFVAKFNTTGLLIWSTLYGGTGIDDGNDVITDGANNVILVGNTSSTNFPTQVPYQAALSGTQDAFVVKFNSGCVRQWATYYGGTSTEEALGVACDAGNNVFFTGSTSSADFPVLGASQGTFGGTNDAYVVKLNGVSGFPIWSTYYGGSLSEWGMGVAVDTPGNCIVVGVSTSINNIASTGANQMVNAGAGDAYIAKFSPTGARLWGTYHGGINYEVTGGCAVDSKNNIYWYGEVEDAQPNPAWISTCAYQNKYNGIEDHLISRFDPNGKLLCTTAVGGPGEEDYDAGIVLPHHDIAAYDPFLYITAHVRGGGYPVSPGAFQTLSGTSASNIDAFVNQLCMNICQQQFLGTTATASNTIICPNVPISFSSSVNNACDTTGLRFKWTFTGATPSSSTVSNPVISYSTPGFYSVKLVVSTPCQKDSVLKTNYIIVNPCTINATASTSTICSSTCTNITAAGSSGTAPYTYSWNTGGTNAAINVCPANTTNYTVMVTDASGNYAATTTTVFVHPLLSMTSTSTNATCTTNGNASVTVTSGTAPYTYTWSSGQTSTASGYAPGNYTVTVTDAKGCTLTKSFSLTSSSPVTASFTYSSACVGTLVNFTNTGTSGTGATYNWTISPLTPANVSGTTNNFSFTFLTAGSYSVLHQVSSGGCLATVTNIITITNCTAGPTVTATGSSVCPGVCATVTSSGTGGSSPYTYSWSNGATTQNINPCPATTTTYTVTIRDTGGKTSTSTAVVTINPSVSATATPTNISCNGSNNGLVTAAGAGGSPALTYSWSPPGGSGSTISGLAAGTYTVTVTDSKGCTATSSAAISSPPALSGLFTKGTANCNGCGCKEWIMVNASGGTNPYTYTWPDGYINRFKNKLCPGSYSINVTDKNGCTINVNLTAP